MRCVGNQDAFLNALAMLLLTQHQRDNSCHVNLELVTAQTFASQLSLQDCSMHLPKNI